MPASNGGLLKSSIPFLFLTALALPAALTATVRTPAKAKLVASAPYPAEAKKQNVEGNVVLTGEITPEGKVAGLKVLNSSSPLLNQRAIEFVSRWSFGAPSENGKPIAICLNTVVRFRKDKAKALDPGALPAPMTGNLTLFPVPVKGLANPADEGFPVERDDRGIRGLLDLDVPASLSPKSYKVVLTDVGPSGKAIPLLEKAVNGGGRGSTTISLSFFRAIRADDRAEKGLHTVRVVVDGRNAGGAQYRVGPKKG
jgi:TonB family protein